MPAVRKPRRQHSLAYYAKIRARSRLLENGIVIDDMNLDAIEAEIVNGIEESPEIEMVDTEVDKIISKGLKDSRWSLPTQERDSGNTTDVSEIYSPKKAAVLSSVLNKEPTMSTQQPTSPLSTLTSRQSTVEPLSQLSCHDTISNSRVEDFADKTPVPEELQKMIEAEIRRATQAKANIQICTTAINAVENSLSPMLTGSNKLFVDSLRIFLRASIAQFLQVGPGATPPELPKVPPKSHLNKTSTYEESFPLLEPRSCTKSVDQLEPKEQRKEESWVPASKTGISKHKGQLNLKTTTTSSHQKKPSTTLSQKSIYKKDAAPKTVPKDDRLYDRLFLRIPRDHEWRNLTPAGIREAVIRKMGCSPTLIDKIIPMQCGYAFIAKDEEVRLLLLSFSSRLPENIILEEARKWVSYVLPNIPVNIINLDGTTTVTETQLTSEIERVTTVTPKSVRLRGKSKLGALYRTWIAFFEKDKAPKAGFRLFDDSGRAYNINPRKNNANCKRCLGFHSTGSCSRAPACGRCGSKMHMEKMCQAPVKCRNCGGPHRSDSRSCLARPSRAGAPTKEQLQVIRNAGQREYEAVNRAKAAADKARATSIIAPTILERPSPASSSSAQTAAQIAPVTSTDATPC